MNVYLFDNHGDIEEIEAYDMDEAIEIYRRLNFSGGKEIRQEYVRVKRSGSRRWELAPITILPGDKPQSMEEIEFDLDSRAD